MDALFSGPLSAGSILAAMALLCASHLASIWLRRPRVDVAGKHVVITGGSQGLGRALALLCVQRGARVTVVARTAAKLQEACADIASAGEGFGGRVQHAVLDVSTASCEQVAEMLRQAARTFGRVDVFVANAGTGNGMLLFGVPLSEVQATLENQVSVNLVGGLRCVIAAAQLMASDGQGGRVSIVSSVAGLVTCPGYSIYSATKFGHRGFLAGAYEEFRRHGVHLSVFYPGSIRTPGFASEQESMPLVTQKIEAQCSDVSSAESCAVVLLGGIEGGAREITNELLPSLLVDTPTGGCTPLDALVWALAQVVRGVSSLYMRFMVNRYIEALPVERGRAGAAGPKKAD